MKKISTNAAPAAIGPYSQGIVAGSLVFASGQIPVNPATGEIAGPTIAEQAEQSCLNVAAVLQAAGAGMDRVVKTTCFLADMADFPAFNAVYEKHFVSFPEGARLQLSLGRGAGRHHPADGRGPGLSRRA